MAAFVRGDIVWADVPASHTEGSEQYGNRPWLIVSSDTINRAFPIVLAVPLSSRVKKANRRHRIRVLSSEVQREPAAAHPLDAADMIALTEQLRVLSVDRISERTGKISSLAMSSVEAGIAYVLEMPI